MLKRKISYFLLVTFLLCSATVSLAANTQQDKAVALNKINVLIGDGANFNLEGQLKRSEAATFIVRLLGVENEVLRNASKYKKTSFEDVDENAWYAVYVGYVAENNIVGGYGDGTYRPNNYVTEKQFVKMVLGALGYNQGIDFDWAEVYNFAYNKGLFEDEQYATKTQDNRNYKRGDVIELLYASLKAKLKNEENTVIERLVEKKFVTEEVAVKQGLLKKDSLLMAIDSIVAKNATTLEIKLNEEATLTAGYNILIYDKKNPDTTVAVRNISIEGNIVTVVTLEQDRKRTYSIQLEGFKDLEGNINDVTGELKGIGSTENDENENSNTLITSNYFRISSVEAVTNREIEVAFTHPITSLAETPFTYILKENGNEVIIGDYSNITVKKFHTSDNMIGIYLKDYELKENATYTLDILGSLNSKYKVPLNGGRGDNYNFTISSRATNIKSNVEVVNAEPVAENYIKVNFSKEVDEESALAGVNYMLKDINTGMTLGNSYNVTFIGEGKKKYKEVLVKFTNMVNNHTYEITVKNVKDKYKQSSVKEKVIAFYGYSTMESSVGIEFIYAINKHTVKVYFTEKVSENIVDSLFTISGKSIIKKVFDQEEKQSITLYLAEGTPVTEENEYTLLLANIRDRFNRVISKPITYKFKGTNVVANNLGIAEAKYIAPNKILVIFDRSLRSSSNPVGKYRIQYKENNVTRVIVPTSVEYMSDTEAVLTLSGTTTGVEEILYCTGIIDFSGQTTSSISIDISK